MVFCSENEVSYLDADVLLVQSSRGEADTGDQLAFVHREEKNGMNLSSPLYQNAYITSLFQSRKTATNLQSIPVLTETLTW